MISSEGTQVEGQRRKGAIEQFFLPSRDHTKEQDEAVGQF